MNRGDQVFSRRKHIATATDLLTVGTFQARYLEGPGRTALSVANFHRLRHDALSAFPPRLRCGFLPVGIWGLEL
jgi:hypothetical protein